jgi:hypothetical protein
MTEIVFQSRILFHIDVAHHPVRLYCYKIQLMKLCRQITERNNTIFVQLNLNNSVCITFQFLFHGK